MYKGYLTDMDMMSSESMPIYGTWGPESLFSNNFRTIGTAWQSAAARLGQVETAFRAANATAAPQAVQAAAASPLGVAYELKSGALAPSTIQLFTHTDLELAKQWHLKWLGDIEKVWADYTGTGVKVGVYDSGVEQAHWELNANYDASLAITINGVTMNGDATPGSDAHGTAVAGLIAAARNGSGVVGIAYDASLTGVNIFDPNGSPVNVNGGSAFVEGQAKSAAFDVVNHSYGPIDYVSDTFSSRTVVGTSQYESVQALAYAARTGRDGLGTVEIFAAGNTPQGGQGNAVTTDRHVTAVGAYREADGSASYYATSGAHLLVSAPSNDYEILGGIGQVTTDLLGDRGYSNFDSTTIGADFTDTFGGTSGAAPIVTGVAALMLDANADLGWRDVKDILAASAKLPIAFETGQTAVRLLDGTGSVFLNNSTFKLAGQDANWNGGAMHYSTDYGYGAVDAYAAVRMAEVWSLFGAAKTSANEITVSTGTVTTDMQIEADQLKFSDLNKNIHNDSDPQ